MAPLMSAGGDLLISKTTIVVALHADTLYIVSLVGVALRGIAMHRAIQIIQHCVSKTHRTLTGSTGKGPAGIFLHPNEVKACP